MKKFDKTYYIGFEGEQEVCFVCEQGSSSETLVIWEGYFDQIMRSIKPGKDGWSGLAYHYNMYSGWYEDGSWEIDDLKLALAQFESVDTHGLYKECSEILKLLCNMLKTAIANHQRVLIVRD